MNVLNTFPVFHWWDKHVVLKFNVACWLSLFRNLASQTQHMAMTTCPDYMVNRLRFHLVPLVVRKWRTRWSRRSEYQWQVKWLFSSHLPDNPSSITPSNCLEFEQSVVLHYRLQGKAVWSLSGCHLSLKRVWFTPLCWHRFMRHERVLLPQMPTRDASKITVNTLFVLCAFVRKLSSDLLECCLLWQNQIWCQ